MSNIDSSWVMKQHTLPVDQLNINILNDDCMIHIFEFLSAEEKLNIESVCKRWEAVSKLSWNHFSSVIINTSFENKYLRKYETQNTAFVINVLERCGNYIEKLVFDGYVHKINWSQIFKKIKNCKLFKNNQNLKHVTFKELKLPTESLIGFNPTLIEEFIVDHCFIDFQENLLEFLSRSANLKIFEIHFSTSDINSVIDALNISKNENLTEISLVEFHSIYFTNLRELLMKQKNLRKIYLFDIRYYLLETIFSLNELEEIYLKTLTSEFLCSISRFTNLMSLHVDLCHLDDETLHKISKCSNLKHLSLNTSSYNLTPGGEKYFCNLKKIESIIIENSHAIIYDIDLSNLSKCSNLKKLIIKNINLTEELTSLFTSSYKYEFKNLETFEIEYSNVENEFLARIIHKSPKLINCKISGCRKINKKFIDMVESIKINRFDTHVLNIVYFDYNIKKNDLKKLTPLISLKFIDLLLD